jgi:hypothetical protein
LIYGDYAYLLTICTDDANLRNTNSIVDTRFCADKNFLSFIIDKPLPHKEISSLVKISEKKRVRAKAH